MTQNAISAALAALRERGRFVLTAPTGWGKSTRIPLALLDAAPEGKVLVLEPRRVAARSLARYVAGLHRQKVGGEVGYWVRFDNRTHEGTRLTYMTEGIFLQLLRQNPTLDGISAVIFDEFHERTIFSDAALALVKGLVAAERPDLWVGVMSATLDADRIGAYLDAPVIRAGDPVVEKTEGNADAIWNGRHRVEVRYRPNASLARIFAEIAELGEGAVLIFEPGKAEIAATAEEVRSILPNAWVLPFHSELPDEEQDLVFQPAPEGMRKVVVATNIAETSLTIPDIRFVIDRGMERVFVFDRERGFGGLRLVRISRASAAQRGGRAGRVADGVVFRLWSREEHQRLPEAREPEIRRVDLAGLVLLLKSFGVRYVAHLDFLDHPGVEALEAAERTLYTLGALDREGNLTEIGHAMQRLPLEPHIARMVVEAQRVGGLDTVVKVAALLSVPRILLRPRDKELEARQAQVPFLTVAQQGKSDLFALVAAYEMARQQNFDHRWCRDHFVRCKSLREAHEVMRQLRDILRRHGIKVRPDDDDTDAARRAIAAGFADALWQQGWGDEYRQNGHRAVRGRESVVDAEWVVVAEQRSVTTRRGRTLHLLLGLTAVDPAWLVEIAPADQVETRVENARFDAAQRRVVADRVTVLRGQEVARETIPYDGEDAPAILAEALVNRHWMSRDDPLRPVLEENARLAEEVADLQRRALIARDARASTLLRTWYRERLGGASCLDDVTGEQIRLTEEAVEAITGHNVAELRAEVAAQYPDSVVVRGMEVRFTYQPAYRQVEIRVPEDLLPSLRDENLPALPGYSRRYRLGAVMAQNADDLRRQRAAYEARRINAFRVGQAVTVSHPDGREEVVGYLGLGFYDHAEVYDDLETAREKTAEALMRRLERAANEGLRADGVAWGEMDGLIAASRPRLRQVAVSVEEISSEILEGLKARGAEIARQVRAELTRLREEGREVEEEISRLARSSVLDVETRDELRSARSALNTALHLCNLDEVRAAVERAHAVLDATRPLVEERERWLEDLRRRLGALEGVEAGPFRPEFQDLLREAREALDSWGRAPDLGRAEELISRAEAAVEALTPHLDAIQEAMEAHFRRCPLCGDAMGSNGCSWRHDEGEMALVNFPEGEERAVLVRLVTDAGESLIALTADREGDVRLACHLPTTPFHSIRVERVHLLGEEARKVVERIRDLEWELEDLRERLTAWTPTDDGEDLVDAIFPDVVFHRGEHRGKPQWQARVRHAGREVKLVVGRWSREPEPGKPYTARVAKVLVDRPRFAVALVEIRDVAALRAEIEEKEAQLAALRRSLARLRDGEPEEDDGGEEDTVSLARALAAAWGARVKK